MKKNLHLEQLQSEFLRILAPAAAAATAKLAKIKTKRKKKGKRTHQPLDTPSPLNPTQQIFI